MEQRRLDRRRWRLPESLRRLLAALLLPLVLCGGVAPLRAGGTAVNGRTIESIEFKGLKTLSEETLTYYLGLAIGEKLDLAALNRSIKQLWERNLIDGIEVDSEGTAGGVKLVLTVSERPVLRSIDYQGLKRIEDRLAGQAHDPAHPAAGGGAAVARRAAAGQGLIEEMYAEKGVPFALAQYKSKTGEQRKEGGLQGRQGTRCGSTRSASRERSSPTSGARR
jgi:outer membrane protein assembly factor BamA